MTGLKRKKKRPVRGSGNRTKETAGLKAVRQGNIQKNFRKDDQDALTERT